MSSEIHVPHAKPMSSLDGMTLVALDTNDADTMLGNNLVGWKAAGLKVVSVTPFLFRGVQPGYIVVLYDKKKDPRAQ